MGTVDFFKILIDLGPLDKIDRPFEASAQKDQDFLYQEKDFSQAGLPPCNLSAFRAYSSIILLNLTRFVVLHTNLRDEKDN